MNIQFPTLTPEQTQSIQDVAGSEALKKSQTAQQMNQRLFSNTARMLYDQGEQFVPSLSQFSGIQGKIKLAQNKINAAAGNAVDPAYNDYLKFLQTNIAFANDMRRVLGAQATDSESKAMAQFTLPNLLTMSPNQVVQLRENLNDILTRQEKILRKSPAAQQILPGASMAKQKGTSNDPLGLR